MEVFHESTIFNSRVRCETPLFLPASALRTRVVDRGLLARNNDVVAHVDDLDTLGVPQSDNQHDKFKLTETSNRGETCNQMIKMSNTKQAIASSIDVVVVAQRINRFKTITYWI